MPYHHASSTAGVLAPMPHPHHPALAAHEVLQGHRMQPQAVVALVAHVRQQALPMPRR